LFEWKIGVEKTITKPNAFLYIDRKQLGYIMATSFQQNLSASSIR